MAGRKIRRPAPEPMDTPLSATLRRRRVELGLTLQQIADRMDVSEGTVQRWESGVIRTVRYDKLVPLARILKVAPVELAPPEARKKDPPPREDDGFEIRANQLIHAAARLQPEQKAFLLSVLEAAVRHLPREIPPVSPPQPEDQAAEAPEVPEAGSNNHP